MPAVVRGGRRQAPKGHAPEQGAGAQNAGANTRRSAPSGAKRASSGGAKGRLVIGKGQAIGAVKMSPEVTAWIAITIFILMVSAVLFTGNRANNIASFMGQKVDERLAGFGLGLRKLHLVGVSEKAAPAVMKALAFQENQPYALMDLSKVKERLKQVGWVKSATVRRQFPDVLVVTIVERPTLAVWNLKNQLFVVDDQGVVIPEARADDFPNLPMVAGDGANEVASEIIEMVAGRPQLASRVMAYVRVDTRRWDIYLKDHSIIKLPARDPERALQLLDRLIVKQHILDQGLASIDLIDPESIAIETWDNSTPKLAQKPQAASNAQATSTSTTQN